MAESAFQPGSRSLAAIDGMVAAVGLDFAVGKVPDYGNPGQDVVGERGAMQIPQRQDVMSGLSSAVISSSARRRDRSSREIQLSAISVAMSSHQ